MIVSTDTLEKLFTKFSIFINKVDKKPFTNFKTSDIVRNTENYKYDVYNQAREKLGNKLWKQEDIGTGKIQRAVASAIEVNENLVDWRKQDDFLGRPTSKILETILFNFYNNKIKEVEAFDHMVDEKLSYQLIAYLFFIKDNHRFLPISQKRFDEIFDLLGIVDFKTSRRVSWDNYTTFIDIIEQVHSFLQTKDSKSTLLDAHSFVWILGNQMKNKKLVPSNILESKISQIDTFLFVWNPSKWNWTTLQQRIEQLENTGKTAEMWSCQSHKTIKTGDRAFLARVGSEPKGIFASGYVASEPFLSKHWSGEGKDVFRVIIDFDILLNPNKKPILTSDILNTGKLKMQHWTPQSSGVLIKLELVEELEAVWFNFLTSLDTRSNPYAPGNETEKTYIEGGTSQIIQTRYERNPFARKDCLEHYGYTCRVCKFNFEQTYGGIGKEFIHVHHLKQIAKTRKKHKVNPIKDLRPVCPNCHAMLHRTKSGYTIEEVKSFLLTQKQKS